VPQKYGRIPYGPDSTDAMVEEDAYANSPIESLGRGLAHWQY
jgi:hypothetical protein